DGRAPAPMGARWKSPTPSCCASAMTSGRGTGWSIAGAISTWSAPPISTGAGPISAAPAAKPASRGRDMHPIIILQSALVGALKADAALVALTGTDGVFDAAPRGRPAPYVVIARHDLIARDGDAAPGQEHRLLL